MKKTLFILTLGFAYLFSNGQTPASDSWKIKWNKKQILASGKESEITNIKKIKKTDLDKNYCLEIAYTESDPKKIKEWKRSILFFDDNNQELLRKDSTRSVKLSAAELKKLFGDKKVVKIYTIAIPTDPNLAASVRVRRVHLCTLQLQ